MVVAFSTIAIWMNMTRLRSQLEKRLERDLHIAAISLRVPLWNIDNEAVSGFLEALFADDSIVYAKVLAPDGVSSIKTRPGFEHKEFAFFSQSAQYLASSMDIFHKAERIGTMQLVLSRESMQHQIQTEIIGTMALAGLLIVAIA